MLNAEISEQTFFDVSSFFFAVAKKKLFKAFLVS